MQISDAPGIAVPGASDVEDDLILPKNFYAGARLRGFAPAPPCAS